MASLGQGLGNGQLGAGFGEWPAWGKVWGRRDARLLCDLGESLYLWNLVSWFTKQRSELGGFLTLNF